MSAYWPERCSCAPWHRLAIPLANLEFSPRSSPQTISWATSMTALYVWLSILIYGLIVR